MEIRALQPGDSAAVWRLRLEALEREPLAFAEAPEEHRSTTVESLATRLADSSGGSFVLGLFSDGELQGMLGFIRDQRIKLRHKAVIWGVYVSPRLRGQGAGRALMQACLERAVALEGLRQVKLGVAQANTAARRLYESFGFEVYGEELGSMLVNGELVTELHMVLRLV
jgi:ribosomal protein S18 acetylase RimI-like enzyme